MEFKDYYKVLDVPRDATQDAIKKAFRTLARKFHPDINAGKETEARFKDVNEAYEVLKDPERRAAYDRLGAAPPHGQDDFRAPPDWEGGFSFAGGGPQDDHAFSEFFEALFRRGGNPSGGMRAGRGADSHARIEITVEDAYEGATRQLVLRSPVVGPDGSVSLQNRTVSVQVPRGITQGQHIRLAGQGEPAFGQQAAGDLFLEVAFAAHPVYRPEGRDLYLDLPITPWEAALGGHVVMPTPGGKVDLRIPPNARTGQKMRLKGKGLPAHPGHPAGDIYASLKIVNPKVETTEARAFFERMARDMAFDPRAHMGG